MRTITILLCLLIGISFQLSAQCPPSSRQGVHVVQQNQNLYRIALKYGVSINQLCDWNNISINTPLGLCQELHVAAPRTAVPVSYGYDTSPISSSYAPSFTAKGAPSLSTNYRKQSGNRHTVQAGETVAGLAELYGYTEARFREFNVLGNEVLVPGSVVLSTDSPCGRMAYDDPATNLGYQGGNPYSNGSGNPSVNSGGMSPQQTDPPRGNNQNPSASNPSTSSGGNTGAKANPPAGNASASYMQSVELDMIDEINLMRSNPANYVQYVEEYVAGQRANNGFPQDQGTIDELINDLRNSPVLSHLEPTQCIYTAAYKHGQDLLSLGRTDHVGSDGKWPWDRVLRECPNMTDGNENLVGGPKTVRESVIILLIDQGIPNRGHRRTLMRGDWKYVACYKIGQVGSMPNCWVQKFGL